ncbi:MAG: hypothetical protein RL226_1991 [Bacteroidota bacterium]|jgi:hypothetical protein
MKIKTKIIFAILVLSWLSLIAFGGENPKPADAGLKKEITRSIGYPSIKSMKTEEVVWVSFHIESCGTVSIEAINASNEEVAAYVLRKLQNMKFDAGTGDTLHMRFTFRKEA